MSMISELVKEIRDTELMCQNHTLVDAAKMSALLEKAAGTIEMLSAMIRATNANSGWIPCEERLPEEHDSIFTEVLGTDKLGFLNESLSDNVLVTIKFNSGVTKTDVMSTHDGKWYFSFGDRVNETLSKVIAWRPLPEPYMEVQDETN